MPTASRRIVFVKLSIVFSAALIAVFGFGAYFAKYEKVGAASSGPSPSYTNAPGETNCTACHGSFAVNSGTGSTSISGLPANYLPNQQIPVTINVSQQGAVVFGFQVTAIDSQGRNAGTFTLPAGSPQRMQTVTGNVGGVARRYVEHTIDGITPTQFDTNNWTFTWNTPAQRVGKVTFYVSGNAADSDGSSGGDYIYTTNKASLTGTAVSNFDADGKSDIAVFRPSNGTWYSLNSTNNGFAAAAFGASTDKPAPADYDGDGKTDYAVWRPSTGAWYLQRSAAGFASVTFGQSGDVPVPGDYDGDGKADIAVWRPSNGAWYYLRSSNGAFAFATLGTSTDKPAQGDYDADGKTDFAVFRPSNGTWYIQTSAGAAQTVQFGQNGDRPVQGDYDGDGKTDIAVWRPSNGAWYELNSRTGFYAVAFGANGDKPAPADFDGDGKTDTAVFRSGTWYALRSSDNTFFGVGFGAAGDTPVPTANLAE